METFKTELVGRDAELDILQNWWLDSRQPALVVHGSRGVGKSALVEAFTAHLIDQGVRIASLEDGPHLAILENLSPTQLTAAIEQGKEQGTRVLATTTSWDPDIEAVRLRLAPLATVGTDERTPALRALIALIRSRDLGFEPTDEDLPILNDIARELDGIPYELACAARYSRVIAFEELLGVIRRDRFAIISGKGADFWNRLEEEWATLSTQLQRAATRLPAAGKTFDLAAAASVLNVEKFDAMHVLESLDAHAWVESGRTGQIYMRESYRLFALEKASMRDSMATGLVDRSLRAATDDNGARHALHVLESIAPRILKSDDDDIYRFRVAHALLTWRLHGAERAMESLSDESATSHLRRALELAVELQGAPDVASVDSSKHQRLLNELLRALPQYEDSEEETLTTRAALTLLSSSTAPFERAAMRCVRMCLPRALVLEVFRDVHDPEHEALVLTPECDVIWLEDERLEAIERSPNLRHFLATVVNTESQREGWCPTELILERLWPNETGTKAASNRLYVAASRLRSGGLENELEAESGRGYRISPERRVVVLRA